MIILCSSPCYVSPTCLLASGYGKMRGKFAMIDERVVKTQDCNSAHVYVSTDQLILRRLEIVVLKDVNTS